MAIAGVSTSHLGYGGVAQNTAPITPPGLSNSTDLVLVFLQVEAANETITKPSGWTQEAAVSSGVDLTGYLFWKYLTGSEVSADWLFTLPGARWRTADAIVFRGGPTSGNPFGGTVATASGAGTTARASLSYTTSGAGMGIWIHSNYNDATGITIPSGYTSIVSNTDHDYAFARRVDAAGSLTTGATSAATTASHLMMAQTLLDSATLGDGEPITQENGIALALEGGGMLLI